MLLFLVGACVLVSAFKPAMAADWPQFRGPHGDGLAEGTSLPVEWNQTEHVRWKVSIPGTGSLVDGVAVAVAVAVETGVLTSAFIESTRYSGVWTAR